MKSVKIGGFKYKIKITKDPILINGVEGYGSHCFSDKVITISDRDVSIQQQKQSTLHEIIHAINGERNLGLSEQIVVDLSLGLFAFMQDNKKLVKELIK